MARNMIHLYGEEVLAPRLTPWRTTPFRLFAGYSIYSQLPSILEAVPPSEPEDASCHGDKYSLIMAGHVWRRENVLPTEFVFRSIQPVPQSLYRLCSPTLYTKELGNTDAPSTSCKNIRLSTRSKKVLDFLHLWSLKLWLCYAERCLRAVLYHTWYQI